MRARSVCRAEKRGFQTDARSSIELGPREKMDLSRPCHVQSGK